MRRSPTRSSAELGTQVAATKHVDRVRAALAGEQSGVVLVDDLDQGLAVVDAYAAEHLEIQTADARAVAARVRNAGADLRRTVVAGEPRRLRGRVQPRAADRRLRAALAADCPCRRSCAASTSSSTSAGGTARGRRPRRHARRRRGPAGARRRRHASTVPRESAAVDRPAAARRAAWPGTLRRAAARRAGAAQRQREPLPTALPLVVADAAAAVAEAVRGLNRYPDRDAVDLRGDLAAYLGTRRSTAARCGRPTAPTRSCCSCCRPSVGPGAPRCRSHRPTRCTRSSRATLPPAGSVAATRARLRHRPERTRSTQVRRHRADVVLLASPNNPTGTALPLDLVEAVATGPPRHRGRGRGVRRVPPRPARPARLTLLSDHPRLAVTRTMCKAFALAGGAARLPRSDRAGRRRRCASSGCPYHLSARHAGRRPGGARARRRAARRRSTRIRAERDRAGVWLCGLRACTVPTPTPTSCSSGRFDDRHAVWQGLLDRGVLIRETGPTAGCG